MYQARIENRDGKMNYFKFLYGTIIRLKINETDSLYRCKYIYTSIINLIYNYEKEKAAFIYIYQRNPNLKRLIAKTANIDKGFA